MKKVIILIGIVFLVVLSGCSTENNKTTDDILHETNEHTTLSAPINQEKDFIESQDIKEVKDIGNNIKISYFNKEISTNRFDEGKKYSVLNSEKKFTQWNYSCWFPKRYIVR